MSISYKNYVLEADTHQSPETKKWWTSISISLQDTSGKTSFYSFTLTTKFDTKKEADDNAYITGKLIIDGKHSSKLPF